MDKLLDIMQTKQIKLYHYQKEKNLLAARMINDEIKELECFINYIVDLGIPSDISIPGNIIFNVLSIIEECNEIKNNIEDIEFYVEVEYGDDYDENEEYDFDFHIRELEDKLSDKEAEIYTALEKYINVNH